MYKFSTPMPYEKGNIDKLLDINNHVEKSRITTLYGSLPSTCELFVGFEQYRNCSLKNTSWNYWKDLISHSLDKGVDFIYLLNSPARLPIEAPDFEEKLDKLDRLLNELRKLGVNKLRIAEHKLMSYIAKHYKDFDIYASTSFEFNSLAQYQNFMFMHPTLKQIVPSHDSIKNFTLLKNLKKLLPNVEIELMVNEGCINGCPNRDGHASEIMDRQTIHRNDITISNGYYTNVFCVKYEKQKPILTMVQANNIFPWEIEEYSKIGINKFKLVGRDLYTHRIENYIEEYLAYFKAIDNYKNAEDVSIITFIHHLMGSQELQGLTTKEVKHLLPNIEHFKKYGHLCASRCGVECRYCYKCAEKIQKVFEKKMREREKVPHYVPACTIKSLPPSPQPSP